MRYPDTELLDGIAREYVVGTLHGRARSRFETVLRSNETARRLVRAWEERLLPLSLGLAPVTPQASVWRAVESRLDSEAGGRGAGDRDEGGRGTMQRFRFAIAAMIALVAVGLGWLLFTRPGEPTAVAVLAPEGQSAVLLPMPTSSPLVPETPQAARQVTRPRTRSRIDASRVEEQAVGARLGFHRSR